MARLAIPALFRYVCPHAKKSRARSKSPAAQRPFRERFKGVAKNWDAQLAARLRQASNGIMIKDIAKLTGDHPENVRRHLINGRISARFLWAFCQALEVDPRWVLSGKGGIKRR